MTHVATKIKEVELTEVDLVEAQNIELPSPEVYGWFWCQSIEDFVKEANECLENGYPKEWVIVSLHFHVRDNTFHAIIERLGFIEKTCTTI